LFFQISRLLPKGLFSTLSCREGVGISREAIREELDEAASRPAALRRSARTEANTAWFVSHSLEDRIIKGLELDVLERKIEPAKMGRTGKFK